MDELPNNDCGYNAELKIESEDDLLILDEATGVKKYTPVTQEDVTCFKREAEHLCKEILYAVDNFQRNIGKRKSLTYYYHIYQNLAEQLTDFLKFIHSLHKKVYISIYKSYDDEFMAIYTAVLENILNEFQTFAKKHAVYIQNVEEYEQIPGAKEIFEQCEKQNTPAGIMFSEFETRYKNFFSTGLELAMEKAITTIHEISNDFLALYRTRIFRTDHEAVIIYRYIKRIFDEQTLPSHLEHVAKVQKRHLRERRIDITTLSLQKVMNDIEGKYNNYTLCSDWFEREEDEEEELVRTLVREQASPEDFETLFKYQGEHKMWEAEIARADEYERHGDPFFANWVDSVKLEEKLKFWIKGNIKSQQRWYIVWCLMKYTFHMVRDNQDKAAFAARMNLMFPDAEKKCVVESFRKQETQKNHNHHFSEWLEGSDPDYKIAQSLYEKLKKTEDYKRSI
ncbi:hypothetical protein KSW85_12275 [Prevotella copri]|uniref:hypothetical protein n=1 Tax=Segatella copri TaxID=165179 RepID=UPI001C38FCA6|nr:hypothetical protein [Segatella copri]MBV3402567.1 hypothetical protein [Segatella copri]